MANITLLIISAQDFNPLTVNYKYRSAGLVKTKSSPLLREMRSVLRKALTLVFSRLIIDEQGQERIIDGKKSLVEDFIWEQPLKYR